MADGGNFGFDDSRIVAKIMDKHLIDFSCLGSNLPSSSEKIPQHMFANGSSGEGQDYHHTCFRQRLNGMATAD